MAWEVEFTDEFGDWWKTLTEDQQDDIAYSVGLLAELGAAAILLLGGDKTGDDRWYEKFVPVADQLYDDHLDELRKEGKL
jgi:hypothetical protein